MKKKWLAMGMAVMMVIGLIGCKADGGGSSQETAGISPEEQPSDSQENGEQQEDAASEDRKSVV